LTPSRPILFSPGNGRCDLPLHDNSLVTHSPGAFVSVAGELGSERACLRPVGGVERSRFDRGSLRRRRAEFAGVISEPPGSNPVPTAACAAGTTHSCLARRASPSDPPRGRTVLNARRRSFTASRGSLIAEDLPRRGIAQSPNDLRAGVNQFNMRALPAIDGFVVPTMDGGRQRTSLAVTVDYVALARPPRGAPMSSPGRVATA